MHDYEIGVFKMTLAQLIRILYSMGPEVVQELNRRQVALETLWRQELTRDAQVPSYSYLWSGHDSEVYGGRVRHEEHVSKTL